MSNVSSEKGGLDPGSLTLSILIIVLGKLLQFLMVNIGGIQPSEGPSKTRGTHISLRHLGMGAGVSDSALYRA